MIYTEQKERSHRFKLALRMGLPIFFLTILALMIFFTSSNVTFESIVFYTFLLLATAIYFIFYLIYQSSYEHITDSITHTFTSDYFFNLFRKSKKGGIQTVILVSIDNLTAINERYGIKNGNKTMQNVLMLINTFFSSKGVKKLPICRYKGGDFFLLLEGKKNLYSGWIEIFLAKFSNTLMDEIEIKTSAVYLDSDLAGTEEEIITRLYELKHAHTYEEEEGISVEKIESSIEEAMENKRYSIGTQVVNHENENFLDVSIKLVNNEGKMIHQNRFIPYINRMGKIRHFETDILKIMVQQSVHDQRHYSIMVSGVTLRNGIFFQEAMELLQLYPTAKNKITLIIEEKEYSSQIKRFKEQIAQYRAVGYNIALDEYGSNHTSMMYLKEFEVDVIRFDSLYTRHLKEERYQNIIHGLNITAHLCGAETWMSKIEDEESHNLARQLKINRLQGNYYGKIDLLEITI